MYLYLHDIEILKYFYNIAAIFRLFGRVWRIWNEQWNFEAYQDAWNALDSIV